VTPALADRAAALFTLVHPARDGLRARKNDLEIIQFVFNLFFLEAFCDISRRQAEYLLSVSSWTLYQATTIPTHASLEKVVTYCR
jgi:hypothetical protein